MGGSLGLADNQPIMPLMRIDQDHHIIGKS